MVADPLAGADILVEEASQEAAVLPGALVALLAAEEVREEEDTRVFLRARGIHSRERRVLAVGSFLVFASRQVVEAVREVQTFQEAREAVRPALGVASLHAFAFRLEAQLLLQAQFFPTPRRGQPARLGSSGGSGRSGRSSAHR